MTEDKDARIAALKAQLAAQLAAERAVHAETRKALDALDRMNRGLDWCDQDEQARRWAAARRVLEAQGGENG